MDQRDTVGCHLVTSRRPPGKSFVAGLVYWKQLLAPLAYDETLSGGILSTAVCRLPWHSQTLVQCEEAARQQLHMCKVRLVHANSRAKALRTGNAGQSHHAARVSPYSGLLGLTRPTGMSRAELVSVKHVSSRVPVWEQRAADGRSVLKPTWSSSQDAKLHASMTKSLSWSFRIAGHSNSKKLQTGPAKLLCGIIDPDHVNVLMIATSGRTGLHIHPGVYRCSLPALELCYLWLHSVSGGALEVGATGDLEASRSLHFLVDGGHNLELGTS